jgi:FkbM family methyltransferase
MPSAEGSTIPDPAPAASGPRRRDWLLAGLGGVAGLAAGGAIGRAMWSEPEPPPEAVLSYSQCGEDLILAWWMKLLEIEHPTYLDIGVWEPVRSNNTYAFACNGGRGVLVEPNPALAEKIREARPNDTLLPVGVGLNDAAEADFFMFNDSSLNTFDPEQRDRVLKDPHFRLEQTVKVPLVKVNRIIAEQFAGRAPDILSVDVEGLELAIVQSVDLAAYRPKVICTETLVTLTRTHRGETAAYLAQKGYEVRGMTYANTIFVDRAVL